MASPQVQQRWYCETCDEETEHVAQGGTDKRQWGVTRFRQCVKCSNRLQTIEIRFETFNAIRIALISARTAAGERMRQAETQREALEEALQAIREPEVQRPVHNAPVERFEGGVELEEIEK